MAEALKSCIAAGQALPAPGRSVSAVAGAIPHQADHFPLQAIVRHAGSHVGVVVLHLYKGQTQALGILGGHIIRVQVAGSDGGFHIKQMLEMGDLLGIILQGLHVLQVTDVLAGKNIAAFGETEAGLLLRPAGQNALQRPFHPQGKGHIAPGAAGGILLPFQHPAEGIVAAGLDLPVMEQKAVGNAPQFVQGLGVFEKNGRVRQVGAGHDQHIQVVPKQQVMQRRIGQHHAQTAVFAEVVQPRLPLLQQHNGPAKAGENLLLRFRQAADAPDTVHIPAHEGKGLFIPLLSPAQLSDQGLLITAAGQMHPAQALDRNDLPFFQRFPCQLYAVAGTFVPGLVQIEHPWAAIGAAIRLGMVAPVLNIMVLPLTIRAHGEAGHGGLGPVIGDVFNDRKTGAAIGTVDEGIAVAPVPGVTQFPQAVLTDADVRRDQGVAEFLPLALTDLEAFVAPKFRRIAGFHALDHGQNGGLLRQQRHKALQRRALPFQLQRHAGGGIFYVAAETAAAHQLMDEGPEAHALHNAADF